MAKKDKEIDVRFSKFGTVSFTSTTKVNDFMDRLEQGKVSGTKCKGCGKTYFPPGPIATTAWRAIWNGLM